MTDSPDASAAMHGRVLALAGIAQALAQVRRLADTGTGRIVGGEFISINWYYAAIKSGGNKRRPSSAPAESASRFIYAESRWCRFSAPAVAAIVDGQQP